MKGNLVTAAAVFAAGLMIAGIIVVVGVGRAIDRGMTRFEAAVRDHARSVESAGDRAGTPISTAMADLSNAMKHHATAVERSGETIARPVVRMNGPMELKQPVMIKGLREDGAIPVNAKVGK